jgi:AcrR family transcriptional regulator
LRVRSAVDEPGPAPGPAAIRNARGRGRPKPALQRLDWIQAGLQLLIDGGISSVKLVTLTRRLGVTSGSFYHHFDSHRDFLAALADFYGDGNMERILVALEPVQDPANRIRRIRTLAEEWDVARLDSAMRVWGTSDERARAAVAQLDDRLIELLRSAFTELGFSDNEARVRSLFAYAAGVGQPFLFGRPADSDDAATALELLLQRPPGSS